MKLIYFTSFIVSLISLASLAVANTKNHETVLSLDQFYDACNSNSSYTVVKYFTTWCSHCKKLAPVFDELSEIYLNDETSPNIKFLDVDCDMFGSTICAKLPGFPVVQVIKPASSVIQSNKSPNEYENRSIFKRILDFVTSRFENPKWTLDEKRVVEFRGRRDLETMNKFVNQVILKHNQDTLILNLLKDSEFKCEGERVILCKEGKKYLNEKLVNLNNLEELLKERKKLENVYRNNIESIEKKNEEEAKDIISVLEKISFKLSMIDLYEDTVIREDTKDDGDFADIVHDEF
ncbi:hypothetical protein TPHA_0M00670 [Tetrapisispora phaffii CBS 4417]|uniref:Thioredoxin domain-containing protein n=1 Tax=Tetrapisispora phaffii (strain ATCC 24235 / CBS 4417 / NBRC 1672 / NRRL Y-8282 / UCD 70-5) TaxID=1071381 RepID=G8C0C7_TETPH|nr:hypothetical protein TPHA_0M00670 [Tetrapisispora phaffii CBS 4417]CCE65642.1 hypothetical protein TPHA_0M00670 [Tetrapisispora phaffii CBS 4417]